VTVSPKKTSLTVLQLLPALHAGGVERGTLEISRFLVKNNHQSLVMSAGGRMVDQLLAEGGLHYDWPVGKKSLFSLRWIPLLRRFFIEHQVDIIHVRSRVPAWLAWLAWRSMNPATRPRFVTTAHGLYSVSQWSAIMTRGERVIAVSNTVSDYLRANYQFDANKIRVIHRGVDPDEFPYGYQPGQHWLQHWYEQYPVLQGKSVLVLPARLTRWKGQLIFVRLIDQLRQRGLDVYGLIVGEADARKKHYEREVRSLINALRLHRHIVLAGHRSDLRNVLSVSTVVLSLSSQPEAFGRTIPEALSLGKPAAGFAHGGVGEVLQQWYPAGKVTPNDENHLLEVVTQLLRSPPPVPQQPEFTLQHMQQATLDVYRELVP